MWPTRSRGGVGLARRATGIASVTLACSVLVLILGGAPSQARSPHRYLSAVTRLVPSGLAKAGHVRPRLLETEADVVSATITPDGTPSTVSITNAGDTAALTFNETAGHYIYLEFSGSFYYWSNLVVTNPDGSQLESGPFGAEYLGRTLVSQTGTYTITLSPNSSTPTGSATFTLFDVPADYSGTIAINGAPSSISLSTPGQRGYLSFSGTAGTSIFVGIGSGSYYYSTVAVINPDGSTLTSMNYGNGYIDKTTLPQNGTYQLWLYPDQCPCAGDLTGDVAFQIWAVPPDDSGTMSIGSQATMTISTPGQRGIRTFSGTAGQVVKVTWTGTFSSYNVALLNPDGTILASTYPWSNDLTATLPTDGTYELKFSPNESQANDRTGSATFQLDLETPAATAAPSITGDDEDGQTLTADPGTWTGSPSSYSYQWQRCPDSGSCSAIAGATASTYTLLDEDVSNELQVAVTATNSYGSTAATSSSTPHVRVAHYSHSTSACTSDIEDPVNLLIDYPRVIYTQFYDVGVGYDTYDWTSGPTGGYAAAAIAQDLWNEGLGSTDSYHDYGSNGGCVDQNAYATDSTTSGHHVRFWVSTEGRRPTGAAHHDFLCNTEHSSDQWIESAEALANFMATYVDYNGYQPGPMWTDYQDRPYTTIDKCGEQVPDDGYTQEIDFRADNVMHISGNGGGGLP